MNDTPSSSGFLAWLVLLCAAALCALGYFRGLSGGFLFDDFPNIVGNPALQAIPQGKADWLSIALLSGAGVLRRPISMLSFGLNIYAFGMNPFAFKAVNLCIHLCNGLLVFAIGRRIAGRLLAQGHAKTVRPELLAALAAGLWLLHPLNVSGVLYIVQRMNQLATLFALLGLFCYVDGRIRILRGEPGLLQPFAGLCVFGLLALLSKENGALIVGFALVIETFCFRFEAPAPQDRMIKAFFWLSVALPIALMCTYLLIHPQILEYSRNGFTLYTRLLSEARVVCDYLLWIFLPLPALMSIFHDDIAVSSSLLAPKSTILAIAFLLLLVFAAWKLRHRSPGFAFGIAWFLVGHAMESTFLPLELVFEHRNYLPMAGLLLGVVCAIAPSARATLPKNGVAVACGVLLACLAGATSTRATSWGNPLSLALDDARHHPASSRSQYEAGRQIMIDGDRRNELALAKQAAIPYFERAIAADAHDVFPAAALIQVRAETGTVTASDLKALADRLRTAQSGEQANAFLDFVVTASKGGLSLKPQDMSVLIEAFFANARWRPQVRAMMYNDYGAYLFNVVHDNQGAIKLTSAAAAEDPQNPYFELNLAKIALALGYTDKAAEHLAAARNLNKAGIYDAAIADLTVTVNNAHAAAK